MRNLAGLGLVFALVTGIVLVVASVDDPAESQAPSDSAVFDSGPGLAELKGASMVGAPALPVAKITALPVAEGNLAALEPAGIAAPTETAHAQENGTQENGTQENGTQESGTQETDKPTLTRGTEDLLFVTFKQVSGFKYMEPDPGKPDTLKKHQVPDDVAALDGKRVAMEGYLIPLDVEEDGRHAKTFFLMPNTLACCFGQLPEINEVVELRFDEPQKVTKDVLIRVLGKFEVGEEFDEYGYLMSLYRIHGESLLDPWNQ